MSPDMLHSQNQQYHALGRNDEISRVTMKCVWASQVFPFVSSSALVVSALVQSGCVAGCPSQASSRRERAPCFFYSVLLTVVLGITELKGWCPSADQRPFAVESSHGDLHGPIQGPQGISWQVLHVIGKRLYQYHKGPAQSLNISNMSTRHSHSTLPQSAGEAWRL